MEAFIVKILASLLIIVLITSNVVAEKLSMENKNGIDSHTLGTKNSTEEDYSQNVTGIRRVLHEQFVFNIPNRRCYTQFFVRGQPPEGLRRPYDAGTRYICQPPRPNQQVTYYATMFDEGIGIAVFSAYTLRRAPDEGERDLFQGGINLRWIPTPGILRQGSDDLYSHQFPYQKGHLAPAFTLSRNQGMYDSTYTYTNAVPQCQRFNSWTHWARFEKRIREYAMQCTRADPWLQAGELYLLTGTSFVHVQRGNPPQSNHVHVEWFNEDNPTIAIPNSLWTAGCCVRPNGNAESFAVMGNNVQDGDEELTRQITIAQLQNILTADVNHHNMGRGNVNLFPGNANCRLNDLGNLPE